MPPPFPTTCPLLTFLFKKLYWKIRVFIERIIGINGALKKEGAMDIRLRNEARARLGDHWRSLGPKEAILDIFRRVHSGENFGEGWAGIIYVQEVAELLGISEYAVWKHCDELFTEERIDLNGAILIPYVRRFRFPKEIQDLFRLMIELPLGWPNGDAGDCFLAELEGAIGAIHEGARFPSGKDAFGENYPHIRPFHLAMFGVKWAQIAADRAEGGDGAEFRALNLQKMAETLEVLADRYRRLDEKINPAGETG